MNNEPKVLILGGNRGSWSAKERASEATTMTGIEAWVFAFGGDYQEGRSTRIRDIAGYDIIIANSNSFGLKNLLLLQSKKSSQSKWVTLIEGDALEYIKPQSYIRDLLDNSDLVNCINAHSLPFFKKLTTARVEYIGIPYPAEGVRALSTPIEKRRREIFLAPMLLQSWLEYFAVKGMGMPFYGYEKRLNRKFRTMNKNIGHRSFDAAFFRKKVRSLYKEPAMTIREEEPLPNFFRRNGGTYLWLNLDPRYTWGRLVLDAAALQVPIITTRSTGHAEKFFPYTTLENEFDLDMVGCLIERLISNSDFYHQVANIPLDRFEEFRGNNKKKQLLELLQQV